MIIKEFYKTREDEINLFISYSDQNKYIRQIETNRVYESAIDVENAPFTYEETNIDIEQSENE